MEEQRSHKPPVTGSNPVRRTKIMIECRFCQRVSKNKNSLINHERLCKENPNRQILDVWYLKKNNPNPENQYSKAEKLGLPRPTMSVETRKKISDCSRLQQWTTERKQRHSERMKSAVLSNPDSYTSSNRGRTRQITVDGIKFQGQWEVDFYLWTKKNGLRVERPKNGFLYEYNGLRTYYPDFYIPSLSVYVEIKGYETEKDKAKWGKFPHRLIVLRQKDIDKIRKDNFSLPL